MFQHLRTSPHRSTERHCILLTAVTIRAMLRAEGTSLIGFGYNAGQHTSYAHIEFADEEKAAACGRKLRGLEAHF